MKRIRYQLKSFSKHTAVESNHKLSLIAAFYAHFQLGISLNQPIDRDEQFSTK